jgi:small subunit ribosomal protein S8
MISSERVMIPASQLKESIAEVLTREGYIRGYTIKLKTNRRFIEMYLKYGTDGTKVINYLERVSKPGRRVYVSCTEIPTVRSGLGTCVLSTSRGILTGQDAKRQRVGGELLCVVW